MKTSILLVPLFALVATLSASAESMYWVDGTSYFNAPKEGKINGRNVWDIQRDFNSTAQSTYSENYNWATGYTINEVVDNGVTYKVPVYTYAETPTIPTATTDVYFKYSDFAAGSSSIGYRYRIAGAMTMSADVTVKSMTIESANDNWMMFRTNGYNLTILEDLSFNSVSVNWIGDNAKSTITIGGNVNIKGGGTGIWNTFRLGGTAVKSISAGGIVFHTNSRIDLGVGGSTGTFDNAQLNVTGATDFGSYASRIDLGRGAQTSEQFFAFNGIKGTNSGASITTNAENSSTGIVSTLVLTNTDIATFAGKVSNALLGQDGRALNNTVSVVMNGTSTQILSGANDFRGYVQIEKGKLLLKTADGAMHGKLTLNGGTFGAVVNAKVSSAEWNDGKFSVFNTSDSVALMTPETISIDGAFKKSGTGKILFDFNNVSTFDLVDSGEWFDLIVASSIEGFLADANGDFASTNLTGTFSIFKWVENTTLGTSTLQVNFSSVPEPATIATIFGALAFALAIYRRRR